MSPQAISAPGGTILAGVDVAVLDVKRRPPSTPDGLVARPRLVERVLSAPDASVVLLIAPAGHGKTTLLTEWADADERPFAWVTLDPSDDDAARLAAAVAFALHGVDPLDPDVFGGLDGDPSNIIGVAVPRLCRSLARSGREWVLAIDDAHLLHTPGSLEVLAKLVEHLPPGCQVALATRQEPSLPVGRLRAHRRLVELGPDDLAMSRSEADQLLRASGLELAPDQLAELMARTGGWPAGLYLSALALRDQPELDEAIEAFGGEDLLVAGYLHDELLSQVSPGDLRFLTRTSVLDRLTGGLCDAVLGRQGSAGTLSRMARSNLLIARLDRTDECYAYHPLLAGMLRSQLRRSEPEREADLHARASAWHAAHDDPDRAIAHAIAAGDAVRAGDLLWRHVPRQLFQGCREDVGRWMSGFSEEQVAANPSLALVAAVGELSAGNGNRLAVWTSVAADGLHRAAPAERRPELETGLAIMRAATGEGGLGAMRSRAASAHELVAPNGPWGSVCRLLEGVALHLGGAGDRARPLLEDGARRGAAVALASQTICLAQLALLAADEDDWDSAEVLAARATAQAVRRGIADHPTQALVSAVTALVRARKGRVEEASDDLHRARRLLAGLSDFLPWYEAEVRLTLARAAPRLSEVASARTLLTEAGRCLRDMPDAVVLHRWLQDGRRLTSRAAAIDEESSLTTAELRVLQHLPSHLSIREIAGRLFVSPNTVKTHARAVYRKLDASCRAEAVVHAREAGLLDLDLDRAA